MHTQSDSPGGITRCGQSTFPSEYYEDRHTCSFCKTNGTSGLRLT